MRYASLNSRMAARLIRAAVFAGAAVIALAGCDGSTVTRSEESAPATGQTTSPATEDVPDTPVVAAPIDRRVYERTAFLSPSGNIGCQLGLEGVRCDIDQRDWSPPPRPADCRLDYGQGIGMTIGEPAQFVCAGDTARAGGEPLPYGQALLAGPIRCESAQSGITCRDVESGYGFSISRETYRFF
jgi:hypothetical protein